ncbi:SAM-dependent methyltransferase [Oricola cellulosilytica]|uniref:Class I SAM-dependent methyltransferase n=1 Tax=Oricola cellulosilytica TaxID=1429082 RepID=A0A4R0PCN5_9HYPH|nr:cyclopropane-fatty-acyl-phospholipid synthase family protein [Oricola cellulosilytica]TCD14293.1 class I SAM-dependent methyltransferase [Oricola cellulosilytica]
MPSTVLTILNRYLDDQDIQGRLSVTYPDGKTRSYGKGNGESVHVEVTSWPVLWRIALSPDPGVAEAYMDGELIFRDGDPATLLKLIYTARPPQPGFQPHPLFSADRLRYFVRRLHQFNPKPRARANAKRHYDLSRALYDLFLDEDRQYSCAYFSDPDLTLDAAQEAKKRHIAAKLLLKPGMKVLDIGSGWGGLGLTLARDHGALVRGVTLSDEQLALSRQRAKTSGLSEHVQFDLMDYRDVAGPFDRIVSVGMFEHVGVNHYAEFFRKSRSLLCDKGVMLLHTIGRTGPPGVTSAFIRRHIFPGGYIPALSEIMQAAEPSGLHVTDVEVLTDHYAETLKHWRERFMARRDEAVRLYDDRFARMWEFYLAASEAAFRYQDMVVFQVQFARDKLAIPRTRQYITDFDREGIAGAHGMKAAE